MPVAKLVPDKAVFFLCDIQTRFRTVIHGFDELILTTNKMLKVASILEIPVLVSQQNPQALGPIVPEIPLDFLGPLYLGTVDKTLFSMVTPEVKSVLNSRHHLKSIVLFGIESHVCVLQTALDLLELGYDVHVLADGVSSCNKEEVSIALARISQAGGQVTTSESAAFQLCRDASVPNFKQFAGVIKEEKENTKKTVEMLLRSRSNL